ncbi:MAG: hypothetical protein ABW072_01610 [Sedimenticola sp.]
MDERTSFIGEPGGCCDLHAPGETLIRNSASTAWSDLWQEFLSSVSVLNWPGRITVHRERLVTATSKLADELDTFAVFTDHLAETQYQAPLLSTPWQYLPLYSSGIFRAGLLTTFRDTPVPLHDHPGGTGIQLLLKGRLEASVYSARRTQSANGRLLILSHKHQALLGPGDHTLFTARHNIHGLSSISSRSVLLSLRFKPEQAREKTFYFPVNPFLGNAEDILVYPAQRSPIRNTAPSLF